MTFLDSRRRTAENYICDMLFEVEKDVRHEKGTPTPNQFKALVDILENCFTKAADASEEPKT